jgi:hypothetical protein
MSCYVNRRSVDLPPALLSLRVHLAPLPVALVPTVLSVHVDFDHVGVKLPPTCCTPAYRIDVARDCMETMRDSSQRTPRTLLPLRSTKGVYMEWPESAASLYMRGKTTPKPALDFARTLPEQQGKVAPARRAWCEQHGDARNCRVRLFIWDADDLDAALARTLSGLLASIEHRFHVGFVRVSYECTSPRETAFPRPHQEARAFLDALLTEHGCPPLAWSRRTEGPVGDVYHRIVM